MTAGRRLSRTRTRTDLTAIEQIKATALWVDFDLSQSCPEYLSLSIPKKLRIRYQDAIQTLSQEEQTAIIRVNYLLMKLDNDRRHNTDYFANKFIGKVETAFASLPEPIEWQSFYLNDLTAYLKMDDEVKQVAVKKKLNKSQAKALNDLKTESQETFQEVKLLKMRALGIPQERIAQRLGLEQQTVSNYLQKLENPQNFVNILSEHKKGFPVPKLAEKYAKLPIPMA